MPKLTFMEFATLAANSIRNDFHNTNKIIKEIQRLPKKEVMLVTAYTCDQLQGEQGYAYFLGALALQT